MPLFRQHRESLADSLATTKIVHTKQDIVDCVKHGFYYFMKIEHLEISPYGFNKGILATYKEQRCSGCGCCLILNTFDDRIGWYTQLVRFKAEDGHYYVLGFLSEPLYEHIC